MKTDSKAERERRAIRWGCVAAGMLGLTPGLAAIGIEILRNWEYGMASGGAVVAATYALFAVGLAVIPGIAAKKGWNAGLAALMVGCMAMTGFFGLSYYAGSILEKANAAKNRTVQYRDARQGIERASRAMEDARAEASRAQAAADAVAEQTPSAELQRLADAAMARRDAEADAKRGGCGTICKRAEQDAADYLARKASATAKEAAIARAGAAQDRVNAAQSRLDAQQAKADRGTVDASPLATLAAVQIGGDAEAIAAHIDTFEPVAMVTLMLLFASLVHPSLLVLLDGFAGRAEQATPAAATVTVAAKVVAVKRGRKPMTVDERIQQFAAEKLRAGAGEITGGMLLEAFAEWWRKACPGTTMPATNVISRVIAETGIAKERKGGRTRYAAELVH